MEYTKGEWTVGKGWTFWDTRDLLFVNPNSKIPTPSKVAYVTPDLVEFQTNAHLIAAAPDMYEALKKAVDDFAVWDRMIPELQELVMKALAKAEGK